MSEPTRSDAGDDSPRRWRLALNPMSGTIVVLVGILLAGLGLQYFTDWFEAKGRSAGLALDDTTWEATDLGGVPVVAGNEPFVTFLDGGPQNLFGYEVDFSMGPMNIDTGCNYFPVGGSWQTMSKIDIHLPYGYKPETVAACPDEKLRAQETAFMSALSAAVSYHYQSGADNVGSPPAHPTETLELFGGEGELLMKLTRSRDAHEGP